MRMGSHADDLIIVLIVDPDGNDKTEGGGSREQSQARASTSV